MIPVLGYNPKFQIGGYVYPTILRELDKDDYEISEWRHPDEFGGKFNGRPEYLTASALMTLKLEVYAHLNEVTNLHPDRWDSDCVLPIHSWNKDKEGSSYVTNAAIDRQVSYKDVRKAAQKAKYDKERDEVIAAIETEGDSAIQKAIDKNNETIASWVKHQCRSYVLYGVGAIIGYSTDEMREKAGVVALDQQIKELQAQADQLRRERHEQWKSYVYKEWEDDTEYPEELRKAVLQAIEEGKLTCSRRGPPILV